MTDLGSSRFILETPAIDVYRRVYPRLTLGACARHFMYHSEGVGRVDSRLSLFRPCASIPTPRPFSRATGVFMGLLYDRSRPLGRLYARTREVREEYVHARARARTDGIV